MMGKNPLVNPKPSNPALKQRLTGRSPLANSKSVRYQGYVQVRKSAFRKKVRFPKLGGGEVQIGIFDF